MAFCREDVVALLEKRVVVEEEKIFAGFGQEEAVHVILFFMSGHRPQAGPPPWGPVVPVEVVHEDFAVPQIPFISGRLVEVCVAFYELWPQGIILLGWVESRV